MFLKDVARAYPETPFWADWKIVEPRRKMPADWEAHIRVHNLTAMDEVAFCTGVPPEYKGNPPALRYMLRTHFGNDVNTQFVSVIEPYGKQPFIREVRALTNVIESKTGTARAALEIVLADGRRDVVLINEDPMPQQAGGVTMDGRIGFVRFDATGPALARLFEGRSLEAGAARIALPRAAITGKLARFDMSDVANTRLILDADLPDMALAGKAVLVANQERSDAQLPHRQARRRAHAQQSAAPRWWNASRTWRTTARASSTTSPQATPFRIPLNGAWERAE